MCAVSPALVILLLRQPAYRVSAHPSRFNIEPSACSSTSYRLRKETGNFHLHTCVPSLSSRRLLALPACIDCVRCAYAGENLLVKIADFGLSRDVSTEKSYYTLQTFGRPMPIRSGSILLNCHPPAFAMCLVWFHPPTLPCILPLRVCAQPPTSTRAPTSSKSPLCVFAPPHTRDPSTMNGSAVLVHPPPLAICLRPAANNLTSHVVGSERNARSST